MGKINFNTPVVAQVTLPSGNTYYLKDADLRTWAQVLDGSGQVIGGAEKRITDLESAVEALSNATHWIGITTTALSDGSTTNPITIEGQSVTAVTGDIVADSYGTEFIFNGTAWQQLGASVGTIKAFAHVDEGTVTIVPHGTNSSSAVTFGTHTKATVLKSTVTATVPKASGTKKYLTASASGGAVSVDSTADVITALGTPSTDSFVKSYPGTTKKLETTSVPNVTSGGTAASWSATVANETLTFAWTANTPASFGTAITTATGKVVTSDESGDSVMTGLGTPSTANAIKALGTPTKETVAKSVSMSTQPSVTLNVASSTSTGAVQYVESVGTSGTNAVTFNTTGNTADAITALGTATAAAQTFTGTEETFTVYPKTT